MKKIIFVSNEYHAGKTSVILGLGLNFMQTGKKIGYYKPWSILSERNTENELIDPNLSMFIETLKLNDKISELFGVVIPPNYLSEFTKEKSGTIWNKIINSYEDISKKPRDYFFIEGHGYPYFGEFLDISHQRIADYTQAEPIIIAGMNKFDKDRIVDSVIATKTVFNTNSQIKCILNKIPLDYPSSQLDLIQKQLNKHEISIVGSIPESNILAHPTVSDIFNRIQGEAIIPPEKENESNLVQEFLIGAMEVQSALPYLRKIGSKAVVTGGDRSDLILAAMETNTEMLILTGTKYPESKVLLKARRNNIPILLVPYDTHTVIRQIDSIKWLTPPNNKIKIDEVKKLVKKYVNLEEISSEN